MLPAGKDFVTTAPAATTVLSAIVTPGKMITPPHPYIVSDRDGLKLFVPLAHPALFDVYDFSYKKGNTAPS